MSDEVGKVRILPPRHTELQREKEVVIYKCANEKCAKLFDEKP